MIVVRIHILLVRHSTISLKNSQYYRNIIFFNALLYNLLLKFNSVIFIIKTSAVKFCYFYYNKRININHIKLFYL